MKKALVPLTFALICVASSAFAGGAIVAGGKTNLAIAVDDTRIDGETMKLILTEFGARVSSGEILQYGHVDDESGKSVLCAQYKNVIPYRASLEYVLHVAELGNSQDAVRPVGGCVFSSSY